MPSRRKRKVGTKKWIKSNSVKHGRSRSKYRAKGKGLSPGTTNTRFTQKGRRKLGRKFKKRRSL